MDIITAREIAARVWCDEYFSHVPMDPEAAEEIAKILLRVSDKHEARHDQFRLRIVSDGLGVNSHVYIVDGSGEIVGEVPCTNVEFSLPAVGPSVCRIVTLMTSSSIDLDIPPDQLPEFTKVVMIKNEQAADKV